MGQAQRFPVDGGIVGEAVRNHDWSSTPLGPVEGWRPALRHALELMLDSPESQYLVWGPDLTFFFNDAYRPILGPRLSGALGQSLPALWTDAWEAVRGPFERAFAGEAGRFVDVPVTMARRGLDEETWWTYSVSPIRDGEAVAGVLCFTSETTDKVRAERRAAFLLALSDALRTDDVPATLIATSCEMLGRHLGAERCGFGEVDAEGVHYTVERDWTNGRMPSLTGVMRMDDFGRQVADELRGGRSLRIDDAFADGRTLASVDRYEEAGSLRAALCVPLVIDGGLASVIAVNQTTVRHWRDDEESLVRDVAGRIFQALQRARAEKALTLSAERLEAALARTQESQARLALAVGIAHLGTFEWDTVTGAVEMDGQSREIFGLPADGPVHQDEVFARLTKLDVERAHTLTEAAGAAGTRVEADYRVSRPDGTTRTILSASEPVRDDAAHLRMIGVFHDVTALRQAEAELRALNAELERRIIERTQARGRTWALTPDLMGALNAQGFFETSNPAWQSVLGWSEDEVAGMSIRDLLHPDDVEHTRGGFELARIGQPAIRLLNRYRCKDGSYRWISWVGVPEDGLVYCTGRDVTVEKEREAVLAARTAERDLLASIVQSDTAPICAFDTEFRLIAFNAAHSDEFHRIYDYRVQVGEIFPDLFLPDQAEVMRGFMARALTGEIFSVVEEFGDPAIVKPYWEVSYSPLRDETGRIFGAFHHAQDITGRLRAEAELRNAQEALRQAQKMDAVGQLTGGVAHDFNNLLTVIKSSTDLLKRPDLPADRRERYIGAISDTVTRAAKLTGQLLAFARRQALKPEVFDVGRSLVTIGEMVGTLTGSRIAIAMRMPDAACFVDADPSQFDTAIVNMAVNARDAMDGEGRLTITVLAVPAIPGDRTHPETPGDFVAVSLADTGSGIPAASLDQIFEPFFTTKGVGQGTGLGLSQVIGFVRQSGGEVRVESVLGTGTTFTLYLPRVEAPASVAGEFGEPEPLVEGHGTRVLVVEDNQDVGQFATQTLHDLGYETVWAIDAAQALAELEADAGRFDVVFSDVIMPGMNGVDLAQEIRRRHSELPVILTSGYSHILAQHGTHGFELLHKPYSVEQLSRILRKVARRKRGPARG
jgi:PAS domain S-box-containing protein